MREIETAMQPTPELGSQWKKMCADASSRSLSLSVQCMTGKFTYTSTTFIPNPKNILNDMAAKYAVSKYVKATEHEHSS